MGKEIVRESLTYIDEPAERGLTLYRTQKDPLSELEARDLLSELEKIQVNYPEIVREIRGMVTEPDMGRIAMTLTVFGTHEALHPRATVWSQELNDDPVGASWAIAH